jgi:hypothetical protein
MKETGFLLLSFPLWREVTPEGLSLLAPNCVCLEDEVKQVQSFLDISIKLSSHFVFQRIAAAS